MNDTGLPPFKIHNVRMFIIFRVLFNARFYYPVFSILFLDFGLTLSQFAILNAVWAATIVICEVPSGALADTIGRRNLLVFAGILMVIEVAIWAFVPRTNLTLLFWVFVLNRILSGMAEAAASGADEALAYDSLQQEGHIDDWGRVLERQVQVQAIGFFIAMTLGGVIYDPQLMQKGADFLGLGLVITREQTLRLPIYFTLITAVFVLVTTLRMQEVGGRVHRSKQQSRKAIHDSLCLVWEAGRWIFRTPFVLGMMLFGLLYDSVVRMIVTMSSQYYRIIEIPEALFGVLGSVVALFGFFIPGIARRLCAQRSALFNLLFNGVLILIGLVGMSLVWPKVGVLPALVLFSSLYFVGFFLSHYLNRAASSERRATVLSFKGLFLNLGYGGIGILYSLLLARLRGQITSGPETIAGEAVKNIVFIDSLPWFGWYFTICLTVLLLLFAKSLRSKIL
ncbi:MFS transporter [uncultured Desulfuromusa sp.]|uniref:MFS transporter n=1 Tax=uncultured Desulfuromusa sp. TaxID=219183 RepID=UPI002AA8E46F|nr:MFS transporter [uncultured Desulfuromusa sp.]